LFENSYKASWTHTARVFETLGLWWAIYRPAGDLYVVFAGDLT